MDRTAEVTARLDSRVLTWIACRKNMEADIWASIGTKKQDVKKQIESVWKEWQEIGESVHKLESAIPAGKRARGTADAQTDTGQDRDANEIKEIADLRRELDFVKNQANHMRQSEMEAMKEQLKKDLEREERERRKLINQRRRTLREEAKARKQAELAKEKQGKEKGKKMR